MVGVTSSDWSRLPEHADLFPTICSAFAASCKLIFTILPDLHVQVIDIEQERIVDRSNSRVNIARHGDIDQNMGAAQPLLPSRAAHHRR